MPASNNEQQYQPLTFDAIKIGLASPVMTEILLSLMPMFRDSVPERQKESSKSLFVEKISI